MIADALRTYLWAFCCVAAIPLGSLALLCLQHVTGGAWGVILRRPLEAALRTLPLLALMFGPIGLWCEELYPWANGEYATPYPKNMYLNLDWFRIRAASYFAVWIGLGYLLNSWSREQDRANSPKLERRFRLLAAPGLGLYGLTITFAAIDWVMSLEPDWFSSIFGVLFGVGQILAAFAFAIIVVLKLAEQPPYRGVMVAGHLRDLGSLLLAFVMIWAYLGVSQLILIWSANLKEEVPYYLARSQHGWQFVALAVVALQFFLPFLVLLTRDGKRNPQLLGRVAGMILFARCLDTLWLIVPARPTHYWTIAGASVIALPLLALLWFMYFRWQLRRYPLLPPHVDATATEDHHG